VIRKTYEWILQEVKKDLVFTTAASDIFGNMSVQDPITRDDPKHTPPSTSSGYSRQVVQSIVGDSLLTTLVGAAGRFSSFLVPFFIAAWFGLSDSTDAFFFSYGLIISLTNIFAIVIESTIVPFVVEARARDMQSAARFVADMVKTGVVGVAAITAVLLLFGHYAIRLVTSFDNSGVALAYTLFLEGAVVLSLWTATSVLSGAFNAVQRYSLPAISPAIRSSLILLITFFLKQELGVHAIMLGFVVGEIVRLVLLAWVGHRLNVLSFTLGNPLSVHVRNFLRTAGWLVIGFSVLNLNPVVDRAMASFIGTGSVSILDYAEKAFSIPVALMSFGFLTVLLSKWSNELHLQDPKDVKATVLKTAGVTTMVSTVIGLLCFLFREQLIGLAYGRGAFDLSSVPLVADVFGAYMIGFGPFMGGLVFTRFHLAKKNTRLLMYSAIANSILHVGLNFLLIDEFEVIGLAISTSLTSFSVAIFFLFQFLYSHRPSTQSQNN